MTTCPNCGAQNDPANRFCDQCGARIGGEAAPPAGSVSPDQPTMAAPNCPSCGATVLPGEAFCDNCGASLSAIAPMPVPVTPAADAPTMLASPPPETAPAAAANQQTCKVCGASVLPGERFCDNCGADLSSQHAAPAAVSPIVEPAAATNDDATVVAPIDAIAPPSEQTAPAPAETTTSAADMPTITATPEEIAAATAAQEPAKAAATEEQAAPAPPAEEPAKTAATEEQAAPAPPTEETAATGTRAEEPAAAATPAVDPARKAELEAEVARQQQIIAQFEQMQATFGAATPAAVLAGLDEARTAMAKAESDLAALPPAAPAVDPAEVQRLQDEIARQQQIIAQFEQMQATFGAATPAAVLAGLDEARNALAKAEADFSALTGGAAPAAPAAPAAAPATPTPTAPATEAPTPAAAAQPAGPRLVLADGKEIKLPTDREEIIIGREDPVSNIFPEVDLTPHGGETGGVSRQHARINHKGDQWTITDLNSTNYTRVDGNRLEPNTASPLSDGAKVQFGRVAATFHL